VIDLILIWISAFYLELHCGLVFFFLLVRSSRDDCNYRTRFGLSFGASSVRFSALKYLDPFFVAHFRVFLISFYVCVYFYFISSVRNYLGLLPQIDLLKLWCLV